jgi:transcriptional regulator with XRE-family HTH domain
MDVRARVGINVRRSRERAGLSQEALAHVADLDRTYVSGIERGHRNPTVAVLERLAIALDVRMADLVADDPEVGPGK